MTKLVHIGIKRRSGRYPWGSGGELLTTINTLAARGLSEKEIADGLNMSTGELRNQKSLVTAEAKEAKRLNVVRQKQNGMSVAAISREFGIPKSTVTDLLKENANMKFRIVQNISNKLRNMIDKFGFVDVGVGTEVFMEVPRPKLDNAITLLENEGYLTHTIYQEQLGTQGKKTRIKVLGGPDSTYKELLANKTKVAIPNFFANDTGETFFQPDEIENISSKRVLVKYKDDGGGDKDGLIELRRGVPELNLGEKAYAQVRIGVDERYFMKGMAVTRDDLPDGYDVIYNTSKDNTGNKLDVMKPQIDEGVSKFGAVVKPNMYKQDGEDVFGVVNILGLEKQSAEGAWADWNRNLSSQVLSKQAPRLAKKQLELFYENQAAELKDIQALTNPTVREHLLIEFADKADRATVDLKASALPQQTTAVLLPDPTLKPTEIYAPNYDNGESVVLIRYPHGGVFEVPTLTVNNKKSELKDIIGADAPDAVGIHPDVATVLSGADFDGDFVLVIPNKKGQIRTEPPLEKLKNFDPITEYPYYDGMKVMDDKQKQRLMGDVSNLITDMTIKGANHEEIARAVKHSMVVIDAEKHELNYTQSYRDQGIAALKEKYQGSKRSGASTLISRSRSQERVPVRYDHHSIDKKTGEKVFTYTEEAYQDKKGRIIPKTTSSTKMAEAFYEGKDAYSLSSGTVIESVYAEHANRIKALANEARLSTLTQEATKYSAKARVVYKDEVYSLDKKYKAAIMSRPIERKAQILGGEIYKSIVEADPGMSASDKKKRKGQSLVLARSRLDAAKPVIQITSREWKAIEAGAISPTRLRGVLRNADMDKVRGYATPRAVRAGLSTAKATRARALFRGGYTNAEVASALGVSVSMVQDIDKD